MKILNWVKYFLLLTLLFFLIAGLTYSIYLSANDTGKISFVKETPVEGEFLKQYSYISGEINDPGVYEITESMRIIDLVEMAGGFTEQADSEFIANNLNLSEKLTDEKSIFIPAKKIVSDPLNNKNSESGKINVNSASQTQLETLPGIGPSLASKIIQHRPFNTLDDILNVPGIGESKLQDILNQIEL